MNPRKSLHYLVSNKQFDDNWTYLFALPVSNKQGAGYVPMIWSITDHEIEQMKRDWAIGNLTGMAIA